MNAINEVKMLVARKDWEYPSFKMFVQNKYYDIGWCNSEDKHKINSMDYK